MLTQVLSLAVLEGYLAANPVKSVQRVRSKKSKPKVRAMSREQRDRLLKETPEPYRALFALMAFSGLRPGEAYALELGDLDLETGIVRVERSISIYDQSVKGTKTGEERDVELSDQTVAGMKTHIWLNDTIIRKSGYLFASEAGTVLDHNNAAKQFGPGSEESEAIPVLALRPSTHICIAPPERGRTSALRPKADGAQLGGRDVEVLQQVDAPCRRGEIRESFGFGKTNMEPIPASW